MRLRLETPLRCSAAAAWEAEQEIALLSRLSAPLLVFAKAGGGALPERWRAGDIVTVDSRLLGRISLGTQTIAVVEVDAARRTILTRETGIWIKRWDHRVTVRDAGPAASVYIDDIDYDAGWLGPLLWPAAWVFYNYRQRRRQILAGARGD